MTTEQQELKAHVGQGHCFLDEIIIDTGKMNEITGSRNKTTKTKRNL